ncbi:MAG: TolC family protein [Leptothrix sp. (in: b-proteobacteria)]
MLASHPTILHAQTFEQSVVAARKADAQFAVQQAAVLGRRAQANQAGTVFWPYAGVTYNQADLSVGGKTTSILSLTQPLLSYDRYLLLQQSETLMAQADAEERQATNDMVLRVFSVMVEVIKNREAIRANDIQINGLQEQLNRAVRMRSLGQGTVTEVSDFEVQVAVAQANRLNQQNALQTAERNFNLLTGLHADVVAMTVEPAQARQEIRSFEELMAYVRDNAPSVKIARIGLEQAQIASKRTKAQYVPQVSAQVARTQYAGLPSANVSSVAITLSATIGAAQYYDDQKASTEVLRAQENLRYSQETTVSEATRLFVAVRSFNDEIIARQRALDAARQAVTANVKSYQGGVKTNIDVLASYKNLADAEVALVNSRLLQIEAELRLNLLLDRSSAYSVLSDVSTTFNKSVS